MMPAFTAAVAATPPPLLLAATAPALPPITVELSGVVSVMLGLVVLWLGIIAFFLRRELKANDTAHAGLEAKIQSLQTDVKDLLKGQGEIRGTVGEIKGTVNGLASR